MKKMASSVPAKSQPLHNFSLPQLKWKNHRSGRSKLAGETSSSSPPHRSPSTPWRESPPPFFHPHIPPHPPLMRQSSPSYVSRRSSPLHMRESESESEPNCAVPNDKHYRKVSSKNSSKLVDRSYKGKRSNKICIRFGKNINIKHEDSVPKENHSSAPLDNTVAVPSSTAEEEESLPKTWNLRPRRPPMNHKQSTGGLLKVGSSPLPETRTSRGNNPNKESSEIKYSDHGYLVTSKKQKFSIALSRDEIEEDMYSFTGSKPSRRPKKRPRTLQKQLDTLFPGLWLGSITADSYKVSEAPTKT